MDNQTSQNIEYQQVFGYTPRIQIKRWGTYDKNDSALNVILGTGLALFPGIGCQDDVAALTKWVKEKFLYRNADISGLPPREFENLGFRMNRETVCAQLSLVALALLRLRGVKTIPIEFRTHDGSHAALLVDLSPNSRLYVDPTYGNCMYLYDAAAYLSMTMGAESDPVKGFCYIEKDFRLV